MANYPRRFYRLACPGGARAWGPSRYRTRPRGAGPSRASFPGRAGRTYDIQATRDFLHWATLWTTNCASNGLIVFGTRTRGFFPAAFTGSRKDDGLFSPRMNSSAAELYDKGLNELNASNESNEGGAGTENLRRPRKSSQIVVVTVRHGTETLRGPACARPGTFYHWMVSQNQAGQTEACLPEFHRWFGSA